MAGLLDFLQGASNAAASNVSGPIDLLGMGLRGIGVPVPQNAFLGSQWMRERGLTREPENRMAGLLGEAAGMSLPIVAAAKAPQIARGLLQAGDNLRAPAPMNSATRGQAGAIVYHGSPHKFDKFDSSKIGTGEGAQAYGHGMYFAENPKVADTYRYVHGGGIPAADAVRYGDLEISNIAGVGGAALRPVGAADPGMSAGLLKFPAGGATSTLQNFGVGATPAKLKAILPDYSDDQISALQSLINMRGDGQKAAALLEAKGKSGAADIVRATADKFSVTQMTGPGSHLYKVDLPDEQIAKMLDWDKPWSQQPEAVRKAIDTSALEKFYNTKDLSASQVMYHLNQGRAPADSAEYLRSLGIPGIRYLDGGSRTAGAGTSNYVVFPGNEGLLKILGRE